MEPREPVKLKNGTGTGIGMLMPTWPMSISLWNLRAAAPLWVNRPVPLPNGLALTRAMASSRVSTSRVTSTGPKISWVYTCMSVFTPENRVGPTKLPCS
ncbi:hypothetical protein D3C79_977310 [compost metagenome]